ncbi:hypothetical protein C8R44DRAFT_883337 [Mycena epipterygia]|nr:hypothetical protein C8R44DRAFT_883337 [Mycena epipterygia]
MEEVKAVRFGANWESALAVSIQSTKDEAMEAEKEDTAWWKVYSDRSGIDGKIGAAAVLFRDGVEVRAAQLHLGADSDHTVYESEGVGASLGLGLLWAEPDIEGDATIVVDSKPAIQATRSPYPNSSHYI